MDFKKLLPSYDFEKKVGIPYFITNTPALNGVIKYKVDDFYVEELFKECIPVTNHEFLSKLFPNKGNYLYIVIQKKNYSVNELLDYISSKLRISKSYIGISGIKDKRAVTVQLLSLKNIKAEHVNILNSSRIKVLSSYYSYGPLHLGTHEGNRFVVSIRNIKIDKEKVRKICEELSSYLKGYIPNYFGYQRFGIPRAVTHLIGKELLLNNFKKAIDIMLGYPDPFEPEEIRFFRETYENTRDLKLSLKYLPESLYYEKIVVEYLLQHPDDYEGAISALPATSIRMFIEAYSSYIFNLLLNKRMELGTEVCKGDLIAPLDGLTPVNYCWEAGKEISIEKAEELISKGKATIVLPVIGHKIKLGFGYIRENLNEILINEGLRLKDFKFVVDSKPVFIKGSYRSVFVKLIGELKYYIEDDLILEGCNLILDFGLPRGSYATLVLREFMKSPSEGAYIGKI
jgi:tRNA pseudouridine synthase, TruD family